MVSVKQEAGALAPANGAGANAMNMTEFFLAQLDAEAALSRRALERVPDGRSDWKPHEKSMPLGYLASLVASFPGWVTMTVSLDEFDLTSAENEKYKPQALHTSAELVQAHEEKLTQARQVLANTTDEHLAKPWKFLVHGHVVSETKRYEMLRDGVFSHLAHHRGQLTVYLRLNDASVPALYGPSADEGKG
jgi:uncharacterized damage-inducible protein DinB